MMRTVSNDDDPAPLPAHRPSRRNDIIDAAIRQFARKGFVDASISDVAEEADVVVTAVYYHFSGKEELFSAAVNRVFESISDVVPPPAATTSRATRGRSTPSSTPCGTGSTPIPTRRRCSTCSCPARPARSRRCARSSRRCTCNARSATSPRRGADRPSAARRAIGDVDRADARRSVDLGAHDARSPTGRSAPSRATAPRRVARPRHATGQRLSRLAALAERQQPPRRTRWPAAGGTARAHRARRPWPGRRYTMRLASVLSSPSRRAGFRLCSRRARARRIAPLGTCRSSSPAYTSASVARSGVTSLSNTGHRYSSSSTSNGSTPAHTGWSGSTTSTR